MSKLVLLFKSVIGYPPPPVDENYLVTNEGYELVDNSGIYLVWK